MTQDQIILTIATVVLALATIEMFRTRGRILLVWAVFLLALIPVIRRL